ncbi:hypothetical protein [Aneurinibacillus tyrosinisolvens]|uniref:hypothetical protein n=1 Tax=Aneurinibacillus tyrosinisolvens TaxID=1443435 RepID=UPI00063EE9FD|nr:hypothetical protein [Aneurinibacillus tyrosinisolvens]
MKAPKEYKHRLSTEQLMESFAEGKLVVDLIRQYIIEAFDERPVVQHPYYQKKKEYYLEQLEAGKAEYFIRVYKKSIRDRKECYEIKCRFNGLGFNITLEFMENEKVRTALYNATASYRKAFFDMIKERKKSATS